jgi:hypothetical protein
MKNSRNSKLLVILACVFAGCFYLTASASNCTDTGYSISGYKGNFDDLGTIPCSAKSITFGLPKGGSVTIDISPAACARGYKTREANVYKCGGTDSGHNCSSLAGGVGVTDTTGNCPSLFANKAFENETLARAWFAANITQSCYVHTDRSDPVSSAGLSVCE